MRCLPAASPLRLTPRLIALQRGFPAEHLEAFLHISECSVLTSASVRVLMGNVQKEACLHGQPSHHVVSLQRIPKVDACQMLKAIGSIEKKTFPASEAMKIDTSLLTKANHHVFVLVSADQPNDPLGYAITAQHRHALLMHKICIAPHHRRSKLGMMLLNHLVCIANKSTCRSIELWVDEAREPARCLYSSAGFGELHHVKDYYGPGRNGVKMSLPLR